MFPGPNVFEFQWGFLADNFSLVPGNFSGSIECSFHNDLLELGRIHCEPAIQDVNSVKLWRRQTTTLLSDAQGARYRHRVGC